MTDHEYIISISDEALDAMLLSAAETYYFGSGRKSNRKDNLEYVEINGYLWGSCRCSNHYSYMHVEKFGPSISSRKRRDSYEANEKAPWLMNSIIWRRSPHLKFLGEIHTHPYDSLDSVESARGWDFSDEDREWWPASKDGQYSVWNIYDTDFPLWLVLAVAPLQRVRSSGGATQHDAQGNVWQFDIGELRFWLHAEVGRRDDDGYIQFEKNTWLNLYPPFTNEARARLEGGS